ncbi:hypothetical protein [Lachnospira hominis (ex Liu et al. 2021)]|uniref:Uncharacterized protein n=1 Tax=Lachnospira hominis (ex Liu et al. 2021) TaxID=2763051 RepID=A0ABR7G3I9_9FIRM|nr:hypothetical protein [Lachnospira hominis]MBC5681460.1 hypothetical protein [Lachnospira hominis]
MRIDELCQDKYIYLDWNVVKNMINPRNDKKELDEEMKRIIYFLRKKYKFPYSHGHIKDRANHYDEKYREDVKADFSFFESITDSFCLVRCDELNKFVMIKKPIMDFFDEEIEEEKNRRGFNFQYFLNPEASFRVDMSKINKDHPLYEMLERSNGIYNPFSMSEFLEKLYNEIFVNADKYKKFRAYMEQFEINKEDARNQQNSLKDRDYLDFLLLHMEPFLESMSYDVLELQKKWKSIAENWFSMYHKEVCLELLLTNGYGLLDLHPKFHDKLKKNKNTLDNIVRDGNHAYYASEACYFVSEDGHTREKTQFLYDVYGIKTKVVSEAEFINHFC